MVRTQSKYTGGGPEQDFERCFADGLTTSSAPLTPSAPSPTDSVSGGEPMYLVIPFLTPGKSQRLLEKLATAFFFKVGQHFLKSGEGMHQMIEGRLQLIRAKF